MSKFKILKDGLWAVDPPNPGEYRIIKGMVVDDIPENLIKPMFGGGYIEPVKEEEEKTTSFEDLLGPLARSKKSNAKNSLEEWGKTNLGIDIDKRMTIKKIMEALKEEYENQNG